MKTGYSAQDKRNHGSVHTYVYSYWIEYWIRLLREGFFDVPSKFDILDLFYKQYIIDKKVYP